MTPDQLVESGLQLYMKILDLRIKIFNSGYYLLAQGETMQQVWAEIVAGVADVERRIRDFQAR